MAMEWQFTPDQVVKAEVDYGFENFRNDLFKEVSMNLGAPDPVKIEATYNLLFDFCYWQATGRPVDEFVAQHHHSPPVCEFLRGVADAMTPNIEMLGAVLQRMIMSEVESGVPFEDSVERVATAVRRMSASLPS
jgi:hypothetical protein